MKGHTEGFSFHRTPPHPSSSPAGSLTLLWEMKEIAWTGGGGAGATRFFFFLSDVSLCIHIMILPGDRGAGVQIRPGPGGAAGSGRPPRAIDQNDDRESFGVIYEQKEELSCPATSAQGG